MVNIQHLRHFVAVAETLHFGRAARQLGIAQSALTKSIQRFEALAGCPLFDRSHKRVALTPAGRAVIEDARKTLDQFMRTDRTIARVASGKVAQFRVGFFGGGLGNLLTDIILAFKRRQPRVDLRVQEVGSGQLAARLRDGTLDVGLFSPLLGETEDLVVQVVREVRLVAAVPAASPLAQRSLLRIADLAEYPFIVIRGPQRIPRQCTWDTMISACRSAGFTPNVELEVSRMTTALPLVAGGLGIAIVPENIAVAGVSLVPIVDLPADLHANIALAWAPCQPSPPLAEFIALAGSLSATPQQVLDRTQGLSVLPRPATKATPKPGYPQAGAPN